MLACLPRHGFDKDPRRALFELRAEGRHNHARRLHLGPDDGAFGFVGGLVRRDDYSFKHGLYRLGDEHFINSFVRRRRVAHLQKEAHPIGRDNRLGRRQHHNNGVDASLELSYHAALYAYPA